MLTTIIGAVFTVLGLGLFGTGLVQVIRDARRFAAYGVLGFGAALSIGGIGLLLLHELGQPWVLLAAGLVVLVALVFGNLIGYPLLVIFLLWSGVTMLRRESRSLANALALVAGLGLVFLPSSVGALAPTGAIRTDAVYMVQYGLHLGVVLVVAYFAGVFAVFAVAALAYRWRGSKRHPEAIIVLGAGLIGATVTPLLAGRLRQAATVQRRFTAGEGAPMVITSGGQGPNESRPEGVAMRDFLLTEEHLAPDSVLAETESRSTYENLVFSRRMLSTPNVAVHVVTSSYHVFRAALLTRNLGLTADVSGAKTAWYFLPSSVMREFAALLRDHWRLHAVNVLVMAVLAVVTTVVMVPATVVPT